MSKQPQPTSPTSAERAEAFPYRLLLEHTIDAVFISDLDDRILDVNHAACRLYGYSREELLAMRINDLQAPDRRAPAGTVIRGEIDRYGGRSFETVDVRKDGSRFFVEVTTTLVETLRGQLALSITRDISDRKQIENALRESQRELRQLNTELEERVGQRTAELEAARHELESVLEASPAVIYAAEPVEACTTRYVSPNLLTIFGYPATRALQDPRYLRSRVHPEDRSRVQKAYRTMLDQGQAITEYRFLDGAGRYRWVHDEMRLARSPDGEPEEIAGVLTDITARIEAQQQIRLIQSAVDQVREVVMILDARLEEPGPRILYVNPAFTTVTGFDADQAPGNTPRMLHETADGPGLVDDLRRVVATAATDGEKAYAGESVGYRSDGSRFDSEWTISPVRGPAGRVMQWVLVLRDISRRRQDEELARVHQAELAHVARLSTMGEMASGLAHELNQPLTAIVNYGQGILRRIETGRVDAAALDPAVRQVVDQARRAAEIIRRLRDFVSKRELHRAPVDLNTLVHEVLPLVQPEAREHGIRIETSLVQGLPPVVVDAIQIEQVVLNLVRNAIEAVATIRAKGLGRVMIRTVSDGELVRLDVIDNGPGLTPEQLDHSFDPFFTTKADGMGMGLTISQSMVESHGGRLWAATSVTGATFCLSLPRSSM